jgi:hypothetical protein
MEYEAPKLIEVGSVKDLTLGAWEPGPFPDNTGWTDYSGRKDPYGDPSSR